MHEQDKAANKAEIKRSRSNSFTARLSNGIKSITESPQTQPNKPSSMPNSPSTSPSSSHPAVSTIPTQKKTPSLKLDTSDAVTGGVFPGTTAILPPSQPVPMNSSNIRPTVTPKKSGSIWESPERPSSVVSTISTSYQYTTHSDTGSIASSPGSYLSRPAYGATVLHLPSPSWSTLAEFKRADAQPSRHRMLLNDLLLAELRKLKESTAKEQKQRSKDYIQIKREKSSTKMALSKLNALLKQTKKKKKTRAGTYHLLRMAIKDNRTSVACTLIDDLSPSTLRKKRPIETNRCFLYAMSNGLESVCMVLLEKGFPHNVNNPILDTYTPLPVKADDANLGKYSMDPGEKNYMVPSYFLLAVGIGLDNVVRLMIKRAHLSQTWYGLNALHLASCRGNLTVVQTLLDHGVEAHCGILVQDYILLCRLKSERSRKLARFVRFRKSKKQWKPPSRDVKLLEAERDQRRDSYNSYIKKKKITALELAATCGHTDVVKVILQKYDNKLLSQIQFGFLIQKSIAMSFLFIKHGLLVESYVDAWGANAFHLAARDGQFELVVAFIYLKAVDVNRRGENKWTALHEAISQKNKAIAKFLIKSGADTSLLNSDGETALRLGILAGIADEELSEYFTILDNEEDPSSIIIEMIKKYQNDGVLPAPLLKTSTSTSFVEPFKRRKGPKKLEQSVSNTAEWQSTPGNGVIVPFTGSSSGKEKSFGVWKNVKSVLGGKKDKDRDKAGKQ